MKPNIKVAWDKAALDKIACEVSGRAMTAAAEAAAEIRCLDHHDIVRVVGQDDSGTFLVEACCEPARMLALTAIGRSLN